MFKKTEVSNIYAVVNFKLTVSNVIAQKALGLGNLNVNYI